MISARFGDILSELYLSSAALKRWNDEGRQDDDFPLLQYCMEASFATIEARFDELLANFPVRPVAWLLRFLIAAVRPAAAAARPIASPTNAPTSSPILGGARPAHCRSVPSARDETGNGIALLERAFAMTVAVQPIRDRMHAARVRDIDQAVKQAHHHRRRGGEAQSRRRGGRGGHRGRRFCAGRTHLPGRLHKGDVSSQATSQPTPPRPRIYRQWSCRRRRSPGPAPPAWRRSNAPPGLYRRRQPHAVHQGARQAGPVHAGRSRRAMRPAAVAAPAVRAGRLRPGDPRLRQCHRRRDEPGPRRRASARHGRSDDGVHRADQLRLRHAIDRHRLSLYPRRRRPISCLPAARNR